MPRQKLESGYKQSKKLVSQKKLNYRRITITDRIGVIYDHFVHGMNLLELNAKYDVNYNTLRHILMQYVESGRVDAQQFKRKVAKVKSQRIQSRAGQEQ